MTRESKSTIRVRCAEPDPMGVGDHGNHITRFEVGRAGILRQQLENEAIRLPVIEAQARFLRPRVYDDVLEVSARLASRGGVRVAFDDSVGRESADTLLAVASTSHAAVDGRRRPRRIPGVVRRVVS